MYTCTYVCGKLDLSPVSLAPCILAGEQTRVRSSFVRVCSFLWIVLRRLRHWQTFQENEVQGCNSFLADRLIHANTVYIHQEQEQEAYRFDEQQKRLLRASDASALANGLFFGFLSFSVNATVLALLTYGMTLVKQGAVSPVESCLLPFFHLMGTRP